MDGIGINRRRLLGGIATGMVVSGAAAAALSGKARAAAPASAAGLPTANRRMIMRVDDVGHSLVCNIGTFDAIDYGMVTAADVMLDSPGTVDALEKLRERPWITVGWHMHMWGTPVLPASRVPSLVEQSGEFKGRFRTNLSSSQDVVFEEAVAELNAQLDRCEVILGRIPETANGGNDVAPWGRAVRKVVNDRDIPHDFTASRPTSPSYLAHIQEARERGEEWAQYYPIEPRPAVTPDPKWADRKIMSAAGTEAYVDLLTDSVSQVEANYDPVTFYTEDKGGILDFPPDVVTTQSWHPGYVDYYVYRLGERVNRARAQQFVVGRVQDVAALCDPRLHDWILENRIALIGTREALHGTNDFQEHLRNIGSDLAMAV